MFSLGVRLPRTELELNVFLSTLKMFSSKDLRQFWINYEWWFFCKSASTDQKSSKLRNSSGGSLTSGCLIIIILVFAFSAVTHLLSKEYYRASSKLKSGSNLNFFYTNLTVKLLSLIFCLKSKFSTVK